MLQGFLARAFILKAGSRAVGETGLSGECGEGRAEKAAEKWATKTKDALGKIWKPILQVS